LPPLCRGVEVDDMEPRKAKDATEPSWSDFSSESDVCWLWSD